MKGDEFDDPIVQKRVEQVFTKPWAPWFRKLLGHLFRYYGSTLDPKRMVQAFEAHFKCLDSSKPLTLVERARVKGHLTAFCDFIEMSDSPEFTNTKKSTAKMRGNLPHLFPTDGLSFEELQVFNKEYAHAYSRTIDSDGNPFGATDASHLYFHILIHSMAWFVQGKPRSVAEFNRRMFASYNRPPPKNEFERLQLEDEIKTREKRLQQICDRLGLHLRPSNAKP